MAKTENNFERIGNKNAAARNEIYAKLQGHFASGQLDDPDGLALDLANVIVAAGVAFEDYRRKRKIPAETLSRSCKLVVGNALLPLNIWANFNEGDSVLESFIKGLSGASAAYLFGNLAGYVTVALTGSGIIGSFAVPVAVGYFGYVASEFVTDTLGVAWDTYIGPKVTGEYDEAQKSAVFTVSGNFSGVLRNSKEGMNVTDKDDDELSLPLYKLKRWTIKFRDPADMPLELSFDRETNRYTFKNADGVTNLADFYDKFRPLTALGAFIRPNYYGKTEGSALTEEIARLHHGDFFVQFDNGEVHEVRNLFNKRLPERPFTGDWRRLCEKKIEDWLKAVDADDKATLYGLYTLTSCVDMDSPQVQNFNMKNFLSRHSEEYLQDLVLFFDTLMHPKEKKADGPDIDFVAYKGAKPYRTAYMGNGKPDLATNIQYLFGTDETNDILRALCKKHIFFWIELFGQFFWPVRFSAFAG